MYAKATYTPGAALQITPILSWVNTYHENPEGLSLAQYLRDPTLPNDDAVPYNEHMEVNRTTTGVAGVVRYAGANEIRFNAYVKHSVYTEANNHVFDHQVLTTPGTSVQYTLESGGPQGAVRNSLSLGTDLQWQTNDEHLNPNDYAVENSSVIARQRITQRGAGLFLLDMVGVGREWNFTGSVRVDRIHNGLEDLMKTDSTDNSGSADFSNVTGRLGVTCTPEGGWFTVYAAWGEGFIPPSTEELGTNPSGYGGFNRSLNAATSGSFEAGVRGSPEKDLSCDLTGFFMTTDNDFDRYRIPGRGNGEEGTFYRNIGKSTRYGAELSAEFRPSGFLGFRMAYTYSHFTYNVDTPIPILMDDTTLHRSILNGNWLPNSPEHRLVLAARCDLSEYVTMSITAETMGKSYIDGANVESEAARPYTLLGARAAVRLRLGDLAGELSLQGRNLGDVRYVAFTEPDSGGNSYQPGPGREFFLGLSVQL